MSNCTNLLTSTVMEWLFLALSLLWIKMCLPKIYVEVLTPSTLECNLIWKWVLRDVISTMHSPRLALIQSDWHPLDTVRETQRKAWGDGSTEGSDGAVSQEPTRTAGQKQGRILRESQREHASAGALIWNFQEGMDFFCSKQPSVWYLVMATLVN